MGRDGQLVSRDTTQVGSLTPVSEWSIQGWGEGEKVRRVERMAGAKLHEAGIVGG